MSAILRPLSSTVTLWTLGLLFVLMTIGFGVWTNAFGLETLDRWADPEKVRSMVEAMSEVQREAHWWMTATLDSAYPLTYGCFFAGTAVRFLGRWGPWLALPSWICIPVDLVENIAQLCILSGDSVGLAVKAIATPMKVVIFLLGLCTTLVALAAGLWRRRGQLTPPQW